VGADEGDDDPWRAVGSLEGEASRQDAAVNYI
jgi:hypothetical protein